MSVFFEYPSGKFNYPENLTRITATLRGCQYTYMIICLSDLRMRNVPNKRRRENQRHILCPIIFFRKSCSLWDNVKKYCRAGQTTDDNMAHVHWMLDTWGYKHTLGIRNIYYFCTAKMAVRNRLKVTLYVLWTLILEICNFQTTVRDILLGGSRFGRRYDWGIKLYWCGING